MDFPVRKLDTLKYILNLLLPKPSYSAQSSNPRGQAIIFFLRVNEAAQGVQGLRNELGFLNPVPYAPWLLLAFPTSNMSCTQV